MTDTFTPAFKKLAAKLGKDSGVEKVIQQLFSNITHLNKKEISARLHKAFLAIAPKAPIGEIESFLSKAIQLTGDLALQDELTKIQLSSDDKLRQEAELRKLLLNEKLINLFASALKNAQGMNPKELFEMVNEENLKTTQKESKQRGEQANVGDLESVVVRQLLRLLFQFIDLLMVSAGGKPIFAQTSEEENAPGAGEKIKYIPMPAAPPVAPVRP